MEVLVVIIVMVNDYHSVDGCGSYSNVDTCNSVNVLIVVIVVGAIVVIIVQTTMISTSFRYWWINTGSLDPFRIWVMGCLDGIMDPPMADNWGLIPYMEVRITNQWPTNQDVNIETHTHKRTKQSSWVVSSHLAAVFADHLWSLLVLLILLESSQNVHTTCWGSTSKRWNHHGCSRNKLDCQTRPSSLSMFINIRLIMVHIWSLYGEWWLIITWLVVQ